MKPAGHHDEAEEVWFLARSGATKQSRPHFTAGFFKRGEGDVVENFGGRRRVSAKIE
jgi:hypothetical protein